MWSTLLEQIRAAHEDIETMEMLIIKDLQTEPGSNKARFLQNHRIRKLIDQVSSTTNKLVEIYEDDDCAMKDEVSALGIDVYSNFYNNLKDIRQNHKCKTGSILEYEQILIDDYKPVVRFSGEEAFGKYLDLHELFNIYINSMFGGKMDYAAYLEVFSEPAKIQRNLRLTKEYKDYLGKLVVYLIDFVERTEPLKDLSRIFSKIEAEVAEQVLSRTSLIDLELYDTVEDLIKLGPEKLKEALQELGLKFGGTVRQRAERLFVTKTIPLEKLDRKYFATSSGVCVKEIALMEAKLGKLSELLQDAIVRTKENVQIKQTLTYEEMEIERNQQEEDEDDREVEDDEDLVDKNNKLNIPMGWNGKPIPYWLYKLHGLNKDFNCEICGNQKYRGRRDFEKHFKEWKHQHGMRCLGIPNTKNFNEITSIQEAKELWESIREKQKVDKWQPDLEEEYEDCEGNVYNKRVYADLQRQGLI